MTSNSPLNVPRIPTCARGHLGLQFGLFARYLLSATIILLPACYTLDVTHNLVLSPYSAKTQLGFCIAILARRRVLLPLRPPPTPFQASFGVSQNEFLCFTYVYGFFRHLENLWWGCRNVGVFQITLFLRAFLPGRPWLITFFLASGRVDGAILVQLMFFFFASSRT